MCNINNDNNNYGNYYYSSAKADQGVKVTKDKIRADASAVVKLGTFTDYLFGYATQEGIIIIFIIGHYDWAKF